MQLVLRAAGGSLETCRMAAVPPQLTSTGLSQLKELVLTNTRVSWSQVVTLHHPACELRNLKGWWACR